MRTLSKSQIRLTKSQRIGIFSLLLIFLGVQCFDVFVNRSYADVVFEENHWDTLNQHIVHRDTYEIRVISEDEFDTRDEQQMKMIVPTIRVLPEEENRRKEQKQTMTLFNPNDYSQKDWEGIGLSTQQAKRVLECKESLGGSFISLSQFKNCVAMESSKLEEIASYMVFVKKTDDIRLIDPKDSLSIIKRPSIQIIED